MRSLLQAGALPNSQPPTPVPYGPCAGDPLHMGRPTQLVQCQKKSRPMSALGQKQTFAAQYVMSALHPKADMCGAKKDVR